MSMMLPSGSKRIMTIMLYFTLLVGCLLNKSTTTYGKSLESLDYRVYPRRTAQEAAVIEWGHSAIISAMDAAVAKFGPQTNQAALMEVECRPVLASPLNGIEDGEAVSEFKNANEIFGNMVVMTLSDKLTGYQMAKMAKDSGAVALLTINADEDNPDDIYSLELEEGEEDDIDIPVLMISLGSANILTTATVTPEMEEADVVNHGMPERLRVYAGDDRPFFEEISREEPSLYLVHAMLSKEECNALLKRASDTTEMKNDALQLVTQADKATNIQHTMIWKGMWQTKAQKEVDKRIEQVTGFPEDYFSDFSLLKFQAKTSFWNPHYDMDTLATITVFLEDDDDDGGGPPMVFPSMANPVKIMPRKGMAVIHHTTLGGQVDVESLYAFLPASKNAVVAQKFVLLQSPSHTRKLILPLLSLPFGKLPKFISTTHAKLEQKFGPQDGRMYFDKIFMFIPVLIVAALVQVVTNVAREKMNKNTSNKQEHDKKKKKKKGKKE